MFTDDHTRALTLYNLLSCIVCTVVSVYTFLVALLHSKIFGYELNERPFFGVDGV